MGDVTQANLSQHQFLQFQLIVEIRLSKQEQEITCINNVGFSSH